MGFRRQVLLSFSARRFAIACLALVFVLVSLAEVQHAHDGADEGHASSESLSCGFCLTFDRMIDAPATATTTPSRIDFVRQREIPQARAPFLRSVIRFVPRGPPTL